MHFILLQFAFPSSKTISAIVLLGVKFDFLKEGEE